MDESFVSLPDHEEKKMPRMASTTPFEEESLGVLIGQIEDDEDDREEDDEDGEDGEEE